MASYCCFWCPVMDFSDRLLEDLCPQCGRSYATPLRLRPQSVGPYSIQESISRGYYGAAFRAVQNSLKRTVVLKITPVSLYDFFHKTWDKECAEHARIAEGTPFVAQITDQFVADVSFGPDVLRCNVAVLASIEGPTLEQVFAADDISKQLSPRRAAQVAADLFEILHLFVRHGCSHNDLHAGNIIVQNLPPALQRSNSIDPTIRAVAIDLGSISDASKSGDHHIGDQRQIARHLASLSTSLIKQEITFRSDIDYRIASVIRGLAEHLSPAADAQRIMTAEDSLRAIRNAIRGVEEPWRQPLSLQRFGDAYNAQSLESWHVPKLWIDPDNRWLNKTTVRGPQVITGMRGCGKTMLLRALHFHARAEVAKEPRKDSLNPIEVLSRDRFIGVYASCQKLLDPQNLQPAVSTAIPCPFERLFVAYLRDSVQVLRHLRSLDRRESIGEIDFLLKGALTVLDIPEPTSQGETAFEEYLLQLQFNLADGTSDCRLKMAPAEAFGHLASIIRGASQVFSDKYVLFLLDDVSTRYLSQETVSSVISKLLFQHAFCGFKITTEAQALHRVLLSPGGSAPADPSRDYEEFDLGNEVYRLLQKSSTTAKMNFISEILLKRGNQFKDPLHRLPPLEVLGDVELEVIAEEIASSSETSPDRKRAYRGLRAVQAVCVGDLGDVVKLYDRILQRADIASLPVPDQKQADCFLEHSANLMHFLNRRDQQKKNLALAFAQASGELLQRSARISPSPGSQRRLRQYTKLYVRVDAGPDFESVANNILDLLDAGVFVYDGGVPRSKTHDDDPVLQFKLSFRKLLGLASFMGISDRDRFELSGANLRKWLKEPGNAKDVLISSEAGRPKKSVISTARPPEPGTRIRSKDGDNQQKLRARSSTLLNASIPDSVTKSRALPRVPQLSLDLADVSDEMALIPKLNIGFRTASLAGWNECQVDVVVIALGFEDRTITSAERIFANLTPKRAVLIQYDEDQGQQIRDLIDRHSVPVTVVSDHTELEKHLSSSDEFIVVDTSGLSKPFLFAAVRDALVRARRVGVVHTLAADYYPRNEDLVERGVAQDMAGAEILENISDVLMGEHGPYKLVSVHQEPAEPERWRALLASASPKNDRLLHLLDDRHYEATRILVPPPSTPRRRIAHAAVELAIAASAADANVGRVEVETNDIEEALRQSEQLYGELYFRSGANVEIGLTGSKIHAVAFAALAAAARVSAAWYVKPESVDRARFTTGVAETNCFELFLEKW